MGPRLGSDGDVVESADGGVSDAPSSGMVRAAVDQLHDRARDKSQQIWQRA